MWGVRSVRAWMTCTRVNREGEAGDGTHKHTHTVPNERLKDSPHHSSLPWTGKTVFIHHTIRGGQRQWKIVDFDWPIRAQPCRRQSNGTGVPQCFRGLRIHTLWLPNMDIFMIYSRVEMSHKTQWYKQTELWWKLKPHSSSLQMDSVNDV